MLNGHSKYKLTNLGVLLVVLSSGGLLGCGVTTEPLAGQTITSPIERAVYTGLVTCDSTLIDPLGQITREVTELAVTFEINENGIPIVQGDEVRVNRSVTIGRLVATYTRIQPTENGIVWHFNVSETLNDTTWEGIATSELRTISNNRSLEYRFTTALLATNNSGLNQVCIGMLEP